MRRATRQEEALAERQLEARMARLSPDAKCVRCGQPERDELGPVAGKLSDAGVCFLCSTEVRR